MQPFNDPVIPVVHNVSASTADSIAAIKQILAKQLYQPVLWVDTIKNMSANGVTHMLEMGPGKVLTGLGKRIDKSITTLPVLDQASLEKALEETRER